MFIYIAKKIATANKSNIALTYVLPSTNNSFKCFDISSQINVYLVSVAQIHIIVKHC